MEFFIDPATGESTFDYPWNPEVEFCTSVHEDGWKPATAESLDVDNPFITVTVIGPVACDSGQLLMIQSGYFYYDGAWLSYLGTDWAETFRGGYRPYPAPTTWNAWRLCPPTPPTSPM